MEPQPARSSLDDLHWILGCWRQETDTGHKEECWEADDGVLRGTMVHFRDGRLAFHETLTLESSEQGIRYVAAPMGADPVAFSLTRSGPAFARFENPEHDFPKVIAYRREGDRLTADVGEGEGAFSVVFNRVP